MDNAIYGQLNVFQTIAREGSITAAARKLGIAAPSVSQSLKLLEGKMGVPLFVRTTRSLQLTQAGEALLASTQNALQQIQLAVENVQQQGQAPSGKVRITLSRFAYQLLLAHRLGEFHARYPQIELDIALSDSLVNLIEDGFDLGVRFGNRIDEQMIARKILPPFQEGLYVSAEYAAQFGLPQRVEDLAKHRLIGYRFITSNRIEPLTLTIDGQNTQIEMPVALMCNDPEVMADAVRNGLGIGRIFTANWAQFADRERFLPVLEKYWQNYPALYLYYPQQSSQAKRIRAVVDFLLETPAA